MSPCSQAWLGNGCMGEERRVTVGSSSASPRVVPAILAELGGLLLTEGDSSGSGRAAWRRELWGCVRGQLCAIPAGHD